MGALTVVLGESAGDRAATQAACLRNLCRHHAALIVPSGAGAGYGNARLGAARMKAAKPGEKGDGKLVAKGVAVPLDGHNGSNAEKYGTYQENEFRSPLVAALSTFSADVNTASYANVRRMLNQGNLPPSRTRCSSPSSSTTSPTSTPTPKGDDPVEFNMEMGPCPWNRKHHLVRVGVQAVSHSGRQDAAAQPRLPHRHLGLDVVAQPPAARQAGARTCSSINSARRTASAS